MFEHHTQVHDIIQNAKGTILMLIKDLELEDPDFSNITNVSCHLLDYEGETDEIVDEVVEHLYEILERYYY